MHIHLLNIGLPQDQTYGSKTHFTGGQKLPVPAARLTLTGLEGDGQGDTINHGGPDKAVCVYALEHYAYWAEQYGAPLPLGTFSENWTVPGALETNTVIGEVWAVDEALVQVSQPRQPCSKLAGKAGQRDLPEAIHRNGFSGFYLRVLQPGMVRTGASIRVVERPTGGVTVRFINDLYNKHRTDRADFERALAVPELAESAKKSLRKRMG